MAVRIEGPRNFGAVTNAAVYAVRLEPLDCVGLAALEIHELTFMTKNIDTGLHKLFQRIFYKWLHCEYVHF